MSSDQVDEGRLRSILVKVFHDVLHDEVANALLLVFGYHSDVNNLKETSAIAHNSARVLTRRDRVGRWTVIAPRSVGAAR